MRWILVASGLIVVLLASNCLAERPDFAGDQPSAISILQRSRLLTGQNWWSRFGEPVNATALSQMDASPSDKGMMAGPMPIYGDGYAFAPGSCDCPPPCIWDLWTGYYQNPHRCHPDCHLLHRRCGHCGGCGGACSHCGRGCGQSCAAKAPCGCSAPVSCTTAASGCGCKPVCGKCRQCHLGMWHGFAAHWTKPCGSCSMPLGCCSTVMPDAAPPLYEKQATGKQPMPLLDEAALLPLPRHK
jgi:hypothetical protein